jgi:tRNA (uracil-5-)-methyltransferase
MPAVSLTRPPAVACGERKFIVSPGAFFQANTECTNVLFTLVRDKVRQALVAGESSTLLDVCCGTGVIGLLLAGQVSQVVGVDLCGPAIVDARRNAACNQVSNAFFVHAKAEDVFARLLGTEDRKQRPKLSALDEQEMCKALQAAKTSQAFVAVVDPPRAGLHKSVISALRENALVNTIVYVSCNPTGSFVADAAALCTLQTKGAPFVLLECTPVDMFPNTEHCELVALFKRASPATAAATPATHAPTV